MIKGLRRTGRRATEELTVDIVETPEEKGREESTRRKKDPLREAGHSRLQREKARSKEKRIADSTREE